VKNPPYFDGMTMTPRLVRTSRVRVCWRSRDFRHDGSQLAGRQHFQVEPGRAVPREQGVQPLLQLLRRLAAGNHEVMMRGTSPHSPAEPVGSGVLKGGVDHSSADNEQTSDLRRCDEYKKEVLHSWCRRPRVRHRIITRLGRKGTMLWAVKAVISESFERIHRSKPDRWCVVPLQFLPVRTLNRSA